MRKKEEEEHVEPLVSEQSEGPCFACHLEPERSEAFADEFSKRPLFVSELDLSCSG